MSQDTKEMNFGNYVKKRTLREPDNERNKEKNV